MQKQFVTYEIALKLKELGFDEPCLGRFVGENTFILDSGELSQKQNTTTYAPLSPLWQQVIDWFREKHNIHISIPNYYDGWSIDIRGFKQNINLEYHSEPGNCLENYYEAREQAILKAIEIINNTKNI